jgi:hypothetical protein
MKKNSGNIKKTEKTAVSIHSSAAEYLTFVAATGDNAESVEMRYEDENIWITQKMLAALYNVEVNTINYHIKKIFDDNELIESSVIRNFRITAGDGKTYDTKHYNLQMTIAVEFKVNSERAVQFRKWVNKIAKAHAESEFEKYRIVQDRLYRSDFDRLIEETQADKMGDREHGV